MDREKAKKIIKLYGSPTVKVGNSLLTFARQTQKDVDELEKEDTETLINHWKSLCMMNHVLDQVSLNDLQRINLIETELDERLTGDEKLLLGNWLSKQLDKKDEYQENLYKEQQEGEKK